LKKKTKKQQKKNTTKKRPHKKKLPYGGAGPGRLAGFLGPGARWALGPPAQRLLTALLLS